MADESQPIELATTDDAVEWIRDELAKSASSKGERITMKFLMAALGSIPWIGGLLNAAAEIPGDEQANSANDLRTRWLEEHQRKLGLLQNTLAEISARFTAIGPAIDERIQDPAYLALVRQSFRTWDRAETDEKRKFVANLLTNAAGTRLCSDDVLRLFIGWIDVYHEAHFAVIREIFRTPGITRYGIWSNLYGNPPREDSAEADLYRLLIRDLSTGGVIRQQKETNYAGEFLRKRTSPRGSSPSSTLESAFEDSKPYALTELGSQFVHYTMNEVVPRLSSEGGGQPSPEGGEAP